MRFFKFYSKCKFKLFATGNSNWDLYTMQYKDEKPALVAIAKTESGAEDCSFGSLDYFNWLERQRGNHEFTRVVA